MSHVSAINIKIKDLDALKRAVAGLGMEWREGQTTHKWFGQWVDDYHGTDAAFRFGVKPQDYGVCDHAIAIPGNDKAYEIGVVRQKDGTYLLAWDFWGGGYGLQDKIGRKGEKLIQLYSQEVATKVLAKKGLKVINREYTKDGKLRVVLRGPG